MGHYGFGSHKGIVFTVILLVFVILAVISTSLRVISRKMRDLNLAIDDACAVAATVFIFSNSVYGVTVVTNHGLGMPADDVAPQDIQSIAKSLLVDEVIYAVSLALLKSSMMILYWKLFSAKQSVRISVYITSVVVWAWALAIILAGFLTCRPLAFNWDASIPGGKCGNRNISFMVTGVFNMVTDLMVIAIPVPHIWHLHLPVGRRVGLIAAFAIGLFVSAISMIRVASLQNIIFDELSYTLATPLTWTFLEMDLAIIACNLPLLRPVANFLFPRSWMGSSRDKSDSRAYGTANGTANGAVNGSCKNRSQHVHMSGAENNLLDPNQNNFLGRIWSNYEEHGHSDVELANNAAPPDGIRVSTDLRVETSV